MRTRRRLAGRRRALDPICCNRPKPTQLIAHRAFRFKLYPTAEQEKQFRQYASVVRFIYNLALEQRRDWWRQYRANTGKQINFAFQCRELTPLRAEFGWIAAVSRTCQEQALRDLDRIYEAFLSGRSGYPSLRKRGVNESFRFKAVTCVVRRLNRSWATVYLPKIGNVRFRLTRQIEGKHVNVTVSREPLGWHISFACEVDVAERSCPADLQVGIDRGVAKTLALSDGTFAETPIETLRTLERRCRKQSRALARCKRGSARREKAKRRVAATKAKAVRVRKHFNHVQSARIASKYAVVCIEDLRTANMTASAKGTVAEPGRNVRQKSGLNRAILEQGWHQFETFLSYKLVANGGVLIKVPAAYTSQTCSDCGSISKHHRKSQAVFECSDCAYSGNADTNAAINILRAGTRPSVREPVAAPLIRESREAA